MADKRGKNSRKQSKLSNVETNLLTEILSRKLAYHPGQTQHYETPLTTARLLEVVA